MINLSNNLIRKYPPKFLLPLLDDAYFNPCGVPTEKLVHYFKENNYSSYMHVTRTIDSGFVAYTNERKGNDNCNQPLNYDVKSI